MIPTRMVLPRTLGPSSPPLTRGALEQATPHVPEMRWCKVAIFCIKMTRATLTVPTIFATADGCVHVRWVPTVGREMGAEFDELGRYWWGDATQDGVFELPFGDLDDLCRCASRHLRMAFPG